MTCLEGEKMTRIDCKIAWAKGLTPEEYIGSFIERRGNYILLETDEEGNDCINLDVRSAKYLADMLLRIVEEIREEMKLKR